MTKIVVVTSGKGGVGKTTTSAALATGLALRGFKTTVIDFDVGLRNLDLIMGCERRVVYDLVNVISGDANIKQALIKDKKVDNLFILPASQTRDKDALTTEGVEGVLNALRDDMKMDYIICDSPAGIEKGSEKRRRRRVVGSHDASARTDFVSEIGQNIPVANSAADQCSAFFSSHLQGRNQ